MAGKAAGWSLVVLAALVLGVSGAGGHSLATTTVLVQVIGHGTVTGTSGTINCGDGSTECYYTTTAASGSITLTATADTGWSFTGWGGDCSGSGSCTLTFGSDYEATANFAQGGAGTSTLSVDVTGDASGKGGTVRAATSTATRLIPTARGTSPPGPRSLSSRRPRRGTRSAAGAAPAQVATRAARS